MDVQATSSNDIWTILIAGYAAIVSTFVLGWDAYKWLVSGAKINLSATPYMKVYGGYPEDDSEYISVIATNVGDQPTTIVNLGGMYYDSLWKAYFFRGKPKESFVVTEPSKTQQIPYRFEVGDQWIGLMSQTDEFVEKAKTGYLFLILYTVGSGRGKRVRVKIGNDT
ncbi:hypothetical protein C9980_25335 [Vibrio mediterranei]|uniref:hypothetical protein n=1 Tax=Vibrio mediterranei TaxID=689 RepID=UPI000D186DA2|nr:hypothetical protein [Vibrio mediterranei]PTC02022.1 hypothetical protein C9980_25335 [Vibrio mediterranei]